MKRKTHHHFTPEEHLQAFNYTELGKTEQKLQDFAQFLSQLSKARSANKVFRRNDI